MQQLILRRGEPDVQPVDQYPLYELGGALQQLRVAANEMTSYPFGGSPRPENESHYGALFLADRHLSRLLGGVPFQVHFCRTAAESLLSHVRPLLQQITHPGRGDTGASMPPIDWNWFSIRTAVDVFEHQFSAEVQKTATYAVPDRGIFKTEGLVDAADLHIHSSVRGSVSEFAREEFQAAGRCLAFGLYSASGFHSARAVETVLRDYHKSYLPDQRSDEMSMGQMASALEDTHKAKKRPLRLPRMNTVRHLRDFASFDRNPLMHKTVKLEEIDAVTLFNAAASVIVEMAKDLSEPDSAQLPLLEESQTPLISAPAPKDSSSLSAEEQPS